MWKQNELASSISHLCFWGRADWGIVQAPRSRHTRRELFSPMLRWRSAWQTQKHPRRGGAQRRWEDGHCAHFRVVGTWGSVFSFQGPERWLHFFFFSVTLKYTSKGKIHSSSPVCLFCSLVISQRALLLLYDFSSLIP